jgi:hypothetical protein
MNRYWDFILPVTLIVTATTPTLGQTAIQAAAPIGSGNQSAAPVPDLAGFWGHFSLPSFEPPLAGPGPILNKSRVSRLSVTTVGRCRLGPVRSRAASSN